jgi:hypothetical protein
LAWEFNLLNSHSVSGLLAPEHIETTLSWDDVCQLSVAVSLLDHSSVKSDGVCVLFVDLVVEIELSALVKISRDEGDVANVDLSDQVFSLPFTDTARGGRSNDWIKALIFKDHEFVVLIRVENQT